MSDTGVWQLLYQAGGRSMRVRLLFWAVLLFAIWTVLYGWSLAANPADIGWAIVLVLCGAVALGSLYVYLGLYVTEIASNGERRLLRIRTLTPLGSTPREIPAKSIENVKSFDGELVTDRHHVVAPWLAIRVVDHRLPLIIDMQGEVADQHRLLAALSGK